MERFIKVKGKWIDTLKEQKDFGKIYFISKENKVCMYHLDNPDPTECNVLGLLEDQGNFKITDTLDTFFEDKPNKGYKSYLKYCEERSITPVKKSEFRKRQPKETKR